VQVGFGGPGPGWLVTDDPAEVTVWEPGTWKPVLTVRPASKLPRSSAVSPDGRLLAYHHADGEVRLVRLADGREVARLRPLAGPGLAKKLAFSPDGGRLLALDTGEDARVWDLRRLQAVLDELGLGGPDPLAPPAEAPPRLGLAEVDLGPLAPKP
jgi:YD repeat-containing protein